MKIIETILREASDSSISLSDTLRKSKILANILRNKDFERWVDSELKGYEKTQELPDYRKLKIRSIGNFQNIAQKLKTCIAPISLPEEFRNIASEAKIYDSVGSIEDIVNNGEPILSIPWPPDVIAVLQKVEIIDTMIIYSAYQEISRGRMIAILDTVRNTILDFILILKDEIPGLSDFTFSSETNESQQEKAERIISTKIDKLIGNISIGSENVTQEIYQKVPINNLDALINELSKLGVSDQDLDKLADAINKDGKLKNNAFGKQVNSWCTKTLKLAGKGLLKGGVSIASEILFSLIKSYYGII